MWCAGDKYRRNCAHRGHVLRDLRGICLEELHTQAFFPLFSSLQD